MRMTELVHEDSVHLCIRIPQLVGSAGSLLLSPQCTVSSCVSTQVKPVSQMYDSDG